MRRKLLLQQLDRLVSIKGSVIADPFFVQFSKLTPTAQE